LILVIKNQLRNEIEKLFLFPLEKGNGFPPAAHHHAARTGAANSEATHDGEACEHAGDLQKDPRESQ
jgi:hypothetical protein